MNENSNLLESKYLNSICIQEFKIYLNPSIQLIYLNPRIQIYLNRRIQTYGMNSGDKCSRGKVVSWSWLYEGWIALSHWIEIFSTVVKLAVDRYNLRLRFGIYKLKFLRSIVGSRSVVSQLFV